MGALSDDPKKKIISMLEDDFHTENNTGVTPRISAGWWDQERDSPLITVSQAKTSVLRGGDTGFTSINTNGTPSQLMSGRLNVTCWVQDGDSIGNPKSVVWEYKEAVKRTIRKNFDSDKDFLSIAFTGNDEVVDTDVEPPIYRRICRIKFIYLETGLD